MFPLFSLLSLLPEGGKAFVAGLHPEMLRAWLDTLSTAEPEQAAAGLAGQLQRIRLARNTRGRLRMLDMLAPVIERIVCAFEAELDRARHPLSQALRQEVIAGNRLLKLYAACYRESAERLAGQWMGRGNDRPLRHALVRAMELEKRRLMLAFRAYTPGSKSAWMNLHALHRLARARGQAGTPGPDAKDSPDSLYVETLLMALAEPARLGPGELDRLRFYLERHAAFAQLRDSPGPLRKPQDREGCFLIRPREDGPGRSLQKWSHVEVAGGDLVLDCSPLLKELRRQIDALGLGALPSRIGLPTIARRPEYAAMLGRLHDLWSAPPVRRFARQHFRPRVDLVAGFDDLWCMLAELDRERDREQDPERRGEAAAPAGSATSEWSVVNESPAGFALQYVSGGCGALAVGALAGLRAAQDRGGVHVCLVRRLQSSEQRRTELGLAKYAPFPVPTMITWGGAAAGDRSPVRAIVLPRVPSLDGAAVVIVPPGTLRSGKRVAFRVDGVSRTLLAGAPLERCAAYEIFSLGDPD